MRVRRMLVAVAVMAGALIGTGGVASAAGGSISGTVTNVGSDVVWVFALDPVTRESLGAALVAGDGTYTISDLPADDYLVVFGASHPFFGPSTRSDEAYDNSHTASGATPVSVPADTAVTGIDAQLEPAGGISGSVVADGAPLPGVFVVIEASEETPTQDAVQYRITDSTGSYLFTGLDVGSYTVSVDHDIDEALDYTHPSAVDVTAGATTAVPTLDVSAQVPSGVPSAPTALTGTPGVGRMDLQYTLPASEGSSPLEFVWVAAWPFVVDLAFDADGLGADLSGLVNGVSNRFAVRWENGHGVGPGKVLNATPNGCQYVWFTDVSSASQFCEDIRWLVYQGISEGYADATYRPGAGVSRQAMAAFLYRYAGSPDGLEPTCSEAQFSDVPVSHPFCGEIAWLVDAGITTGYSDGSFRGSSPVSRQAMAAFLYRFAGSPDGLEPTCSEAQFSDVPVSHPFCGEIAWLVDAGITTGYSDGSFRGSSPVSRQAMAAFLHRLATGGSSTAMAARSAAGSTTSEVAPPASEPSWSDSAPAPTPRKVRVPAAALAGPG